MGLNGISSSGIEFPLGREYPPPPREFCAFLLHTLPKMGWGESLEPQDAAKRLINLYEGEGKQRFTLGKVADCFPWMYQTGLIGYRRGWHPKGGYRLFIWKAAEEGVIRQVLMGRPTYLNGEPVQISPPLACASSNPEKKKKRKRCCDNPKAVRNKKTGKRRCKSCGTALPPKKKRND